MEMITQTNGAAATLIARVFLGLLFFFQGYDAVFRIKIKNIINNYEQSFEMIGIPGFLTITGSWFTSCAELVGGVFLILGLFQNYSLYLLGADVLIASFAFSISSPMWDMRFVFPRLILLLFLLLIPQEWNIYSIDHFIKL